MLDELTRRFRDVAPAAEFWSLRFVDERDENLTVRRNIVQPARTHRDTGVMITVADGGGVGYGATSDLGADGLRQAGEKALAWAQTTARAGSAELGTPARTPVQGSYQTLAQRPWAEVPLAEKIDRLRHLSEQLGIDDRILDWETVLWHTELETGIATSTGTRLHQRFHFLVPMMSATANADGDTQTRSFGGHAWARQGGLEVLDAVGFDEAAARIAQEALELLAAPACPSDRRALLLAPDQMILQLHESIGHPLELDRILGDERNYAGTSFVTPDMFGSYQYGSELLNVVFDPIRSEQLASYAFDDDGLEARRETLIESGVLVRGLGGAISQTRSGLPGVANSRANGWNRPPIDRMANLNIEPGTSRFDEMIASVERGIFMETNCSWSIDDARNKFQFGCERARLIENGELTSVVKKPNYRGVSATFWRNLIAVGDESTLQVLGTPFCGKGEPNQVIRVGHASPACLFEDVDVFGGV
jgi:predicted Zn-dependent protease